MLKVCVVTIDNEDVKRCTYTEAVCEYTSFLDNL